MSASPSKLVRGTVDLLVLQALSTEELHGYGVWRWIRDRSEEVVQIEDAALYQALHRLDRKGLVESRWGRSENNRRAKFYRLTSKGRERLRDETAAWRRYAAAVGSLLDPEGSLPRT